MILGQKTRKKFAEEEKRQAIADYVSETRKAQVIANKLGIDFQAIYIWLISLMSRASNNARS